MVDIIHRIGIKASPRKVYSALSTVDGVAGWWTQETTGESKVGGVITVRFADRLTPSVEKGRMELEVTKLDPGKEVRWRFKEGPPEWIGTEVTFSLSQNGESTVLVFGHRNWREPIEFMAHCSMKWATFLLSLRELVETGAGRPSPDDLKIDNWN
ncbi:MAG TPA: SRPBCC domain-containing protein [Thermoanaerobaculia bacterium]|nr:SRPBCC domain-containing protein [Thermoanaerobaculia bacterium]